MKVRTEHGVAIAVAAACLLALLGRPATPALTPRPIARAAVAAAPPSLAPPVAPAPAPRTTIAVLRVGDAGRRVELVSWAEKPVPFDAAATAAPVGAASFVLEDARTGERLAAGPCTLPRLCPCPGTRDHRRGCLRLRHEAVVRLKLPRLAPAERLTIVGPEGPLATFALEGA